MCSKLIENDNKFHRTSDRYSNFASILFLDQFCELDNIKNPWLLLFHKKLKYINMYNNAVFKSFRNRNRFQFYYCSV